jgi:hypothetical protein
MNGGNPAGRAGSVRKDAPEIELAAPDAMFEK